MPDNAPRTITVAAAQMGPIARAEPRGHVVGRLVKMMREAHGRGAGLVVFPELALTSFFPRWFMEDEAELAAFYATATTTRRAPGSIWRSAISRWATSASRSGGRWAA